MKKMFKRLFGLILTLFIGLNLVACGSGNSDDGDGDAEDETSDNELSVYSPHPAEVINLLVDDFEKETDIKVDIVAAGTGELLKRIESEANNPLADVMWGGGAESLAVFEEFYEPYESPELEHIDSEFYSEDFTWLGESPLPMVMMYNTDLVDEDEIPESWEDLLDEEFKGQIAMADPAKSGSAYTILATMIQSFETKEDGWDFIEDFYKNLDGIVLGSSGNVYKGVSDGEYAVGLTLEKEAIKYLDPDSPIGITYPEDGTSAVPDGIAIVKGTKNQELAETFVDYALSKDTQELMSDELQRRSIRDDVEPPEGVPLMEEIELVDYDFDWVSDNKEDILDQWKEIVTSN